MRSLLLVLLSLPCFLLGQDYTFSTTDSPLRQAEEAAHEVLVVPIHPHYIISEVDRMISGDPSLVLETREKLRRRLSMEMTRSLSDSLDALDISITDPDEKIDLVEYVYNSIDYHFVKFEEKEESRSKGLKKLKWPKKKDGRVYGAYSEKNDGQLDRIEVDYDRYMSAGFGNAGAIDYLQDIHSFEHILVLSQLELRRNLESESELPYIGVLHYQLMDARGEAVAGGKVHSYLQGEQLSFTQMKSDVLPELTKLAFLDIWTRLEAQKSETEESLPAQDASDY